MFKESRSPLILQLFAHHNITLLCGAPTVVNMLVNDPKAKETNIKVRPRMATAGAPPAAALIQKAQEILGLNMIHVYGLTETSPFILYNEWKNEFEAKSADEQAIIKARQGIELVFNGETMVVNQDGKEVAWDGKELGEIITRGNVVMEGYYKDPEKTAEAIRDGWFHTGDLAVTYPDGYIEIQDRAKDLIISGEKIFLQQRWKGYCINIQMFWRRRSLPSQTKSGEKRPRQSLCCTPMRK